MTVTDSGFPLQTSLEITFFFFLQWILIGSLCPQDVGFIRAVTKVQTARFKMRRNNIVLDEDMLLSLQELPDTYNYGMYAKFIDDYGTHFMTSGTMGGVFEYILVVNKEEMRRKG